MPIDTELQADVLAELKYEPSVNATHVGVTVREGVVTLLGHVRSYAEKYSAERAVKRVYGVRGLANELVVRLDDSHQRSDEHLAMDAARRIAAIPTIAKDAVKVIVEAGWIRLEGELPWQYQKEVVLDALRQLSGVKGFSNHISIKPSVSASGIRDAIAAAFERSAAIDATHVAVEVHDGRVTLRGSVRSLAERDQAQEAAWAAPGVVHVDNEITIAP